MCILRYFSVPVLHPRRCDMSERPRAEQQLVLPPSPHTLPLHRLKFSLPQMYIPEWCSYHSFQHLSRGFNGKSTFYQLYPHLYHLSVQPTPSDWPHHKWFKGLMIWLNTLIHSFSKYLLNFNIVRLRAHRKIISPLLSFRMRRITLWSNYYIVLIWTFLGPWTLALSDI